MKFQSEVPTEIPEDTNYYMKLLTDNYDIFMAMQPIPRNGKELENSLKKLASIFDRERIMKLLGELKEIDMKSFIKFLRGLFGKSISNISSVGSGVKSGVSSKVSSGFKNSKDFLRTFSNKLIGGFPKLSGTLFFSRKRNKKYRKKRSKKLRKIRRKRSF